MGVISTTSRVVSAKPYCYLCPKGQAMKHLSIIVPAGDVIVDTIIGTYSMFRMANARYRLTHPLQEDLFQIDLVGLNQEPVQYGYSGLFQVQPTTSIEKITQTDVIIVSAISGNLDRGLERNAAFLPWIKQQRIEHDAEIASLCKGAVFVGRNGTSQWKILCDALDHP